MTELLTVKWDHHKTSFLGALQYLRNTDVFSDCTLACDGRVYKLHKVVLSIFSDYLGNIFQEFTYPNPVLILRDTSFEDLEAILDYMYFGEVEIPKHKLDSFLKAGEYLKVKGIALTTKKIPTPNVKKTLIHKTNVSNIQTPPKSKPSKGLESLNVCGNKAPHESIHLHSSKASMAGEKRTIPPTDKHIHKKSKLSKSIGEPTTAKIQNYPISHFQQKYTTPTTSVLKEPFEEVFIGSGIFDKNSDDTNPNSKSITSYSSSDSPSPSKSEVAEEHNELNDSNSNDETDCKMEFAEVPITPFDKSKIAEEHKELNDSNINDETDCKMEFAEVSTTPFDESKLGKEDNTTEDEELDPLSMICSTTDISETAQSSDSFSFQVVLPSSLYESNEYQSFTEDDSSAMPLPFPYNELSSYSQSESENPVSGPSNIEGRLNRIAEKSFRLSARHFPENCPPTKNYARPQRKCVQCTKNKKRKKSTYWCGECSVGLCITPCFKLWHTVE